MHKTVVIGGGAAGMMAAVASAEKGNETILIEKNEKLGKKLFITGKGRCNVTNACETDELLPNVMNNPRFLYSAFYGFDTGQVMNFFEDAGCPLKTERGNRVFPVSDHSSDIIKVLQNKLKESGVQIMLHTCAEEILLREDSHERAVSGVRLDNGSILQADAVIVATGGKSYESTGSTGDGYRFAERTGHTVTGILPSLVPLVAKEDFCREMMGLSLKNVGIELAYNGKILYSGFGEMLFTHFGVSGPLILSASSYYVQKAFGKQAQLTIDLKPALSEEQLDKRLLRDLEENRGRQFKNALTGLLPAKMQQVMVRVSGIDSEKRAGEITREERRKLKELLKCFPVTITGCRGFDEAIITKGGVSVKEISPSTMESKKVKNLFFAGEVLDVDALTGGYNLQIAWSTGHLAGSNA